MHIETLFHRQGTAWSAPLPIAHDSTRTLVLAFGAPDYGSDPALAELAAAFPRSVLAGCSTAGEIIDATVADDTLVVAILHFAHVEPIVAATAVAGIADSQAAGGRIGAALAAHAPQLVLVFADGLLVNGSALAAGLSASLPPGTIVAGGLAADGDRFARTWVLADRAPARGMVSAVALCGPLAVGMGSQGGWDAFGPERQVTRANANVLYELDGRPALALYKEYLGEFAAELPGSALRFPLSIRVGPGAGPSLVRTVLGVDEATQSLRFAGDVPAGWTARLMRSNRDRLIAGALRAAADATAGNDAAPVFALAISCVGRRHVLGQRADEETEATLEALPPGSRQAGFYAYGELAQAGAACELHNQTMTLTTLREDAA